VDKRKSVYAYIYKFVLRGRIIITTTAIKRNSIKYYSFYASKFRFLDDEKSAIMQNILNHSSPSFPPRNDEIYTLKEFLDNADSTYKLPIIVNIASLNNYGRNIKDLLSNNTLLLLIDARQLDSILAEYHGSDGRHHSYRHRLTLTSGKMGSKASTKFRSMKKLSKSLASLTTVNQPRFSLDDVPLDDDDDNTYHQRILVKNLNEKRSSSNPLCRVPTQHRSYFEFLNENDQSSTPYHKLSDMIVIEYDDNNPEKRIEKWPRAFFLRSPCPAFTRKVKSQSLHPSSNDGNSNSGVSADSCYGSSSDLSSPKSPIILNDDAQILQPGQILIVLGDYSAMRTRISDKELRQQRSHSPASPSSPHISPTNWFKSKFFSPKKRRQSHTPETHSSETSRHTSIPNKSEIYLKCRTQQDDIVYISIHESGLFSRLNCQTHRSKSNAEYNLDDITGVFQLKDLLSNFRFPMSIRLLNGSISFDNPYSPALINHHETPTKFRLLMPYTEHVVFACPLNITTSKSQKSSFPFMVIPLSINADIEIQPCLNMNDISQTDAFYKLMENCFRLIEQYQTEISLIHFPLQLTNNTIRRKQPLFKKRSQSEWCIESLEEQSKHKFRHSDDQLNNIYHYKDNSSVTSSPLKYRDSIETIQQKLSAENERQQPPLYQRSGGYSKIKNDNQKRSSRDEYTSEDEIYEDVDKIYDYIRSGDITRDVQKIQAKEHVFEGTSSPTMSVS
jgi:hypothetical protein